MDALLGKAVSHFRIIKKLGAGGMGVVYLARDTYLERDVAVKFLSEEFASDPERLARFRSEAKVLASLNHPHIATIHGLEESGDGALFLVLERVEGQTLAARLKLGRLPLQEALGVCSQIAQALAAAHDLGVIHRDLKPGNVMLTPLGVVKVLDFGLAKRVRVSAGTGEASAATTLTFLTDPGVAMGTAGYASPEQARGEVHDRRTDIFAFGCILYECVTGQRAFRGGSVAEIMVGLLTKEPDWSALPAETPAKVQDLLARCLQKDPNERLRDIGDAPMELEEVLGTHRAPAPRGMRLRAAHNNLPQELTSFVGRDAEITECERLLARSRLLTLTGPGGCGKTRLCLRLAERLLGEHPDGVWFVDLAPICDSSRLPGAAASVLSVREDPGTPLIESIANFLRAKQVLLLLDNCEHLVAACAEAAGVLLRACPGLRLIATSREGLGVPGEQVYSVPPLSVPPRGENQSAASLAAFEAIRLFIDRATLVRQGFHLTDTNAVAVAEICSRLDGIPLAIELAAARVKALSPAEIMAKLNDRFRLLTRGGLAGPERHQTLRTAIQWSYDHLADDEQQLFRTLSAFSGGWTLEAATAISGDGRDEFDVLDLLTRLVDKSLVAVEGGDGRASRYRYLETVREYALERLRDSDGESGARSRHLDFFIALAETAEPNLVDVEAEEAEWLDRLESEHENLLAALAWCDRVEGGHEKALRMAGLLGQFWVSRGHIGLARKWLEDVLGRKGAQARTPARARALNYASAIWFSQGDAARAWSLAEESCAIYRDLGDIRGITRTLLNRGAKAIREDDLATARPLLEECLSVSRKAAYSRGVIGALLHLGALARLQGDLQSARCRFEESLALSREIHAKRPMVVNLFNLSYVLLKLGDPAMGRVPLIEAFRVIQELGAKSLAEGALDGLAIWTSTLGHAAEAARFFGAAGMVRTRMGIPLTGVGADLNEQQAAIRLVRSQLGEERFDLAVAAGRALSFEAAIDEALHWLERCSPDVPSR